jgi:hypothetical protein
MFYWLVGIVLVLLVWARVWQTQPKMAFGILLGLLAAWIISKLITPYVTGMEEVPVWLPPLPFAIVALLLLVFGSLIWFRGAPPLPQDRRDDSQHH